MKAVTSYSLMIAFLGYKHRDSCTSELATETVTGF